MLTNVRDTSLAAHDQLRFEGKLEKLEQVILMWVQNEPRDYMGGFSRLEIATWLPMSINCASGRINTLLAKGRLVEGDIRPCRISGRRVHTVRLP